MAGSLKPAPGSRASMPVEAIEVGEDITGCGYCGGQLLLVEMMPDGGRHEICSGCNQHYHVTDEGESAEDIAEALAGEIEIVDENTGEVIGTTAPGMHAPALDALLRELGGEVPVASTADLNHLFGIKAPPCPYGDEFGSF